MSKPIHVNDVEAVVDSSIVLDTNIWLYLYGPNAYSGNQHTRMYSRVYSDILKNRNVIILENSVISEFSNRFIRINHEVLKKTENAPKLYKDFRNSDYFKPVGEELRDTVLNMIDDTKVEFVGEEELDFEEIFQSFSEGGMDYTDALLVNMCKSRDYFLLTHDFDYHNSNIKLISGNSRYFP